MESAIIDYMSYLKTGNNSEISAVAETIENMLMRLEEYKGTIEMIQSERVEIQSAYKTIINMKTSIRNLAYRIDAMEMFISRVHQDMNTLEMQLFEAEQDYPDKSENPLKNLLKPILSKITPEFSYESSTNAGGMSNSTISSFEKVDIINTDEFFKNT